MAKVLCLVLAGPLFWLASGSRADEAPTPAAASTCVERSIDAIQGRYEAVRDFSASFVQTAVPAHAGAGESVAVISRGRVVIAKPSRMRWVYDPPNASVVVSDGETLWIYDPAFGEAQRLPVGDGYLSGAAVQFLLGEGDMRKEFEIRATHCDDERAELELVPREAATYERLYVVANPRSGDVSETRVRDLLGNLTTIVFAQLRTDTDPPAETFRFDPPEGVQVIDLAPAPESP